MKKLLVALVLIVVLAGIGMPYINGMVMEKVVHQASDNINQMYTDSGSDMKIEIQNYERGFSKSYIEWKIDLGALSGLYGVDEILFLEEAEHGYKGVVSKTHLDKNKWFNEFVQNHLGGTNPLHIETTYPLKGKIVSSIILDTFLFEARDGTSGTVKSGQISFQMDKEFKNIGTDVLWKGVDLGDKIKLQAVSVQSQLNKISTHIWAGQTSFELEELWVKDKRDQIDLKKASAHNRIDYDQEADRLNVSFGMGVDHLAEKGRDVLKNANINLSVNQLDATGYEQFVQMYTEMVYEMMKSMGESGFDPNTTEQMFQRQSAAQGIQIMTEAEKLLKKGLEIRILDLKAQLPQGEIKGELSLTLKKNMTMAGFLPIMMQPKIALDVFELHTRLNMPLALAGKNPNLFQPIYPGMETGLFIKENNRMVHEADTRDGKLFINQNEVNLDLR